MQAVPVIALTGYLGAGKTTLLNHVLRTPGARIGVVINDFGELNVDAGLVTGQVDEPASIAGGCICCLSDDDTLDDALTKLADPKLDLDAIIVEASGMADPVAISRIIRFSGAENVRWGGVVDVIDARAHFDTVDRGGLPPARYGAASLVVVNKLDQVPDTERDNTLERIEARVRELNPDTQIVGVTAGRIDSTLLYDVSARSAEPGQLSFRELLLDAATPPHADDHDHMHADSVTVTSDGCVDPDTLFDLLENPPAGVYRLKGVVAVGYRATIRRYVVNLVGTSIHVAGAPPTATTGIPNHLVAIGVHLDSDEVRDPHEHRTTEPRGATLRPRDSPPAAVPPAQHLTNRHLPSTFSTRPAISSIANGPRTRSAGRPALDGRSARRCAGRGPAAPRTPSARCRSARPAWTSGAPAPRPIRHCARRFPRSRRPVSPVQRRAATVGGIPAEAAEVTGPGTAHTTRPIASAQDAVLAAPLRKPASTTTVARLSTATNRLRVRKRCRAGRTPGGYSVTSRPLADIRCSSAECPAG